MTEDIPLMTSIISTSPSTIMRKFYEGDPLESLSRSWPCSRCGIFLGLIHLIFSIFILIFDIFTNPITLEAYSTTAALMYFLCSLLCFIAVRRLDKTAQILLFISSSISIILSIALFIQNAQTVNQISDKSSCTFPTCIAHAVLICVGLCEGVTCFITTILCYRSLRMAFKVQTSYSPYSTLIIGDYKQLSLKPPLNNPRLNITSSTTFLQ